MEFILESNKEQLEYILNSEFNGLGIEVCPIRAAVNTLRRQKKAAELLKEICKAKGHERDALINRATALCLG